MPTSGTGAASVLPSLASLEDAGLLLLFRPPDEPVLSVARLGGVGNELTLSTAVVASIVEAAAVAVAIIVGAVFGAEAVLRSDISCGSK